MEFKWICSFSRVFAFCYVYSHWILLPFRECTINTKSVSHIHLESTIPFSELKWIHYLLANSPWIHCFPENYYEFTICFAISLSIHYLFCGTTMNSLWNHFETIMKSLWIHYLFCHFSLNWLSFSRIHYLFREFTMNPLSFFLNYYEFTSAFTLSLWKHYKKYPLFRHEFCDFAIFYVEK